MPNAREFKDKINSIDSKESFYKIFKWVYIVNLYRC
jgi:hypothetical protein